MPENRIENHPIIAPPDRERVGFYWAGRALSGFRGEAVSSALVAAGVKSFGHHPKDNAAQGIFCANGQCAQCTVLINGQARKSCMVGLAEGMIIEPLEGLPELPETDVPIKPGRTKRKKVKVLIIGGGPAGLSAAKELGRLGIQTLIIDDKDRLGGKLVLQTHKFFGSIADCRAGTRGLDIGRILADEVTAQRSVTVWLNSTALYAFSDKKVGIVRNDQDYRLVEPELVLVATGAREKSLIFPGNTLPGVYGAGAFQTLVNRDLVKPTERLFIVGGGNVGLIAAYHALQAGIEVVGLVEALPKCGGYKVHEDKLKRLGVPVMTGHTVLAAHGEEALESVTIAAVDTAFQPVPGTEKSFECDTLLIAVGLNPVDEFYKEAVQAGLPVFSAGDAQEIAEASSAIFSGRIAGLEVARELGRVKDEVPAEWRAKAEVLKSHPGPAQEIDYDSYPDSGVFPVFHCAQEIPCNPCTSVCKKDVVEIPGEGLLGRPQLANEDCLGCFKCLFICPGLAISLVDLRKDVENPVVSLAYEVHNHEIQIGDKVELTDLEGRHLARAEVLKTIINKTTRLTAAIQVRVPKAIAPRVAGFRIQGEGVSAPVEDPYHPAQVPDTAMVCRCERVTAGEIRKLIRQGITDLNQIKAITRAGMGACGYKTCEPLMLGLMRAEGVDPAEVTLNTTRPVFVEAPLGVLAGAREVKS